MSSLSVHGSIGKFRCVSLHIFPLHYYWIMIIAKHLVILTLQPKPNVCSSKDDFDVELCPNILLSAIIPLQQC